MVNQQTRDGGYIIAGWTLSENDATNASLIKTDAAGAIAWKKTMGVSQEDFANSVMQTKDSGYIIAGCMNNYFSVMKTDAAGTVEWTKAFGDTFQGEGNSAWQTANGGYVVAGNTRMESGLGYVCLTRIDSVEAPPSRSPWESAWTRYFGGDSRYEVLSMQPVSDGGYVIFAQREPNEVGDYIKKILIKTNANGIVE